VLFNLPRALRRGRPGPRTVSCCRLAGCIRLELAGGISPRAGRADDRYTVGDAPAIRRRSGGSVERSLRPSSRQRAKMGSSGAAATDGSLDGRPDIRPAASAEGRRRGVPERGGRAISSANGGDNEAGPFLYTRVRRTRRWHYVTSCVRPRRVAYPSDVHVRRACIV